MLVATFSNSIIDYNLWLINNLITAGVTLSGLNYFVCDIYVS
jgi:hypothetical protein